MSQESTVSENHMAARLLPLEEALELLDRLHSAASEGKGTRDITGMTDTEALGYLQDILYTTQEAIHEIQAANAQQRQERRTQPILRIVEKINNTKVG